MADRIHVYKRDDGPDDGHIFGPAGYLRTRPWMAGPVPEDPRPTCWPFWEHAMRWATDPAYRVEYQSADEGGW